MSAIDVGNEFEFGCSEWVMNQREPDEEYSVMNNLVFDQLNAMLRNSDKTMDVDFADSVLDHRYSAFVPSAVIVYEVGWHEASRAYFSSTAVSIPNLSAQ